MASMTGKWELSYYTDPILWTQRRTVAFDEGDCHKKLETIRRSGIHWIGINGVNLLEPTECDVLESVNKVAAMLDALGLKVSSFHYAGPTYARLSLSQERVRENMNASIEMFKLWRPKSFVIHANWILGENTTFGVDCAFDKEAEKHGAQAVLETVAENLKYMARLARKYGIRLAVENMGKSPLGAPEDLPKLIEKINEPNAGYCLDSGHANHSGQKPEDWARVMGKKLFETHFHDNRGETDEHMPVGFGTINWIDVINALSEIGFEGPVTFETGGWPLEDPVEGYREAIAWWRACEKIAAQKKTEK